MKIYADKMRQNEIGPTLDFGRVEIGSTKQFTYWIYNDEKYGFLENMVVNLKKFEMNLTVSEVKVVEAPQELKPQEIKKIIFEWKPTLTIRRPMRIKIEIDYELIFKNQ